MVKKDLEFTHGCYDLGFTLSSSVTATNCTAVKDKGLGPADVQDMTLRQRVVNVAFTSFMHLHL